MAWATLEWAAGFKEYGVKEHGHMLERNDVNQTGTAEECVS